VNWGQGRLKLQATLKYAPTHNRAEGFALDEEKRGKGQEYL